MENKKPLWIVLGVFGGVLALTVLLSVLFAGRGKTVRGPADAPYPYRWTEKSDGTVSLTLDGRAEAEGQWSCAGSEGTVSVAVGETERGKAKAEITPAAEGREELIFLLSAGGDTVGRLALTTDTLLTDGKLRTTVSAHSESAQQRRVSGGEETGFPYTVYVNENGVFRIRVQDPTVAADYSEEAEEEFPLTEEQRQEIAQAETVATDEDDDPRAAAVGTEEVEPEESTQAEAAPWTAGSSDSRVARPGSAEPGAEGVEFPIFPGIDGTAEVTVSSERAGLSYVFTLQARNDTLMLTGQSTGKYAPQSSGQEEPSPAEAVQAENLETVVLEGTDDPSEVNFEDDGQLPEPSEVTPASQEPAAPETEEPGETDAQQTEPEPDQPDTSDITYEEYMERLNRPAWVAEAGETATEETETGETASEEAETAQP